jgi:RNA polymerase sigma-70 factor, ECF subfamily
MAPPASPIGSDSASRGPTADHRLIEACRQGDAAAFEALVRAWEGPLFGFIYRYVTDASLAQDLLQETYLRAWQAIGRYRSNGSFNAWLYRIALNLCKDHLKRQRPPMVSLQQTESSIDGRGIKLEERIADPQARTDAAVDTAARVALVQRLLGHLPDKERLVILLKEYQEMTFREIAEILEVPESTVKARLYKGLRTMRAQLEREGAADHRAIVGGFS